MRLAKTKCPAGLFDFLTSVLVRALLLFNQCCLHNIILPSAPDLVHNDYDLQGFLQLRCRDLHFNYPTFALTRNRLHWKHHPRTRRSVGKLSLEEISYMHCCFQVHFFSPISARRKTLAGNKNVNNRFKIMSSFQFAKKTVEQMSLKPMPFFCSFEVTIRLTERGFIQVYFLCSASR